LIKETIIPNTFLIGVQKSATTSFYNWMSMHPDICGPKAIKDVGFFFDDRLYKKGMSFLSNPYKKYYTNQKSILHSNVNYIFFEKALQNIKSLKTDAKFILILRNPVERAISAYYFFVQRGLEQRGILQAFQEEDKIKENGSLQELCDFTYKEHGLYHKQIMQFYKYFDKDNLLILLFDDLKKNPHQELSETFRFLGVNDNFKPDLIYENKTGVPKNTSIQKMIHGNNKIKKVFVNSILDKVLSLEKKNKIKNALSNLFIKENSSLKKETPESLKTDLYQYYKSDVEQLERLLNKDLSNWKIN